MTKRKASAGTSLVLSMTIGLLLTLTACGTVLAGESSWEMTGPNYRAGDFWEYEVNEDGAKYDLKESVVKVPGNYEIETEAQFQNGSATVTIAGKVVLLKSDLSLIEKNILSTETGGPSGTMTMDTTYEYDPPLKRYEWPMNEDSEWDSQTSLTFTETKNGNQTSNVDSVTHHFRVEGIDKMQLMGGDFNAVKIVIDTPEGTMNIWYSAQVGNVVKEEGPSGYSREIKGYQCNDPGSLKGTENGGGGGFDMGAMGEICIYLPLIVGTVIGVMFGAIFGLSSGYSSKIPKVRSKKKKRTGIKRMEGPKFCPMHGVRTEKRGNSYWCETCASYPKPRFKYCPHHGVRLSMIEGVPHCIDCGGKIKW